MSVEPTPEAVAAAAHEIATIDYPNYTENPAFAEKVLRAALSHMAAGEAPDQEDQLDEIAKIIWDNDDLSAYPNKVAKAIWDAGYRRAIDA